MGFLAPLVGILGKGYRPATISDRGTACPQPKPAPCSDDTRQVLRQAHEHVAIIQTSNLVALLRWKLELGHDLDEAGRALGIDPETIRMIRKQIRRPNRRR
jgi:hypothetical protein